MADLIQRIDNTFKNGMKIIGVAGILYLGSLALTYTAVESYQREITKYKPKVEAQINFKHFYNPLDFWKDNKTLIEEGQKLIKENPEPLPIGGPLPVSG